MHVSNTRVFDTVGTEEIKLHILIFSDNFIL